MPTITIGGTIIDFPNSGADPDWSPAVIAFAEAVEMALAGIAGPFDVAPQTIDIDIYNPGSNIDVPFLSFSTTQVRGAFIRYVVYRNTSTTTVVEEGNILLVYNPAGPIGNKWQISPDRVGDASITFSITDNGQVKFTTTTLSGINHNGKIRASAQAFEQI